MKKGDMSINMIVVAAIALLVLVIIAVLLFRSGEDLRVGTSCTGTPGASCESDAACWDLNEYGDGKYIYSPNLECSENRYCCIPI